MARDLEISESTLPRKIEETMRELGMALATLCRKLKELTDERISKPRARVSCANSFAEAITDE